MAADQTMRETILAAVPQQPPFRFIEEIRELDEAGIVGSYRFRREEYFYRGHFPGQPVTPGVILIEAMAQTGVVAQGLYLSLLKSGAALRDLRKITTLFTLPKKWSSWISWPPERKLSFGAVRSISAGAA